MHPAFGPGVRVFGLRPISRRQRGCRNREIGSSGNRVIGTAALLGLGLGLGLGGPWVAQGWPKRHPRVTQGPCERRTEEVPLFATKGGKGRGEGGKNRVIW